MRTIAIINQKGGCGKTTTAINLAAVLAAKGRRTLLVDLDPQAHCAAGLAVPPDRIDLDIGDAMLSLPGRGFEPERLLWRVSRNLELAPSRTKLAGLEASRGGLAAAAERERRLSRVLERLDELDGGFDQCVIDCPPSIGLLTYNAITAANDIIIPVETSFFSLQGATKQVGTIRSLGRRLGTRPVTRLLATIHDDSHDLARDLREELERRFENAVIPVTIREDQKLREAASYGQPVIDYDPASRGAEDYRALGAWVLGEAGEDRADAATIEIRQTDMPLGARRPRASKLDRRDGDEPAGAPAEASRRAAGRVETIRTDPGRDGGLPHEFATAERKAAGEVAAATEEHAGLTVMRAMSRVEDLCRRAQALHQRLSPAPRAEETIVRARAGALRLIENKPSRDRRAKSVARLFGVRPTGDKALFVQPIELGLDVRVAGDFNGWCPTATPMRRNEDLGVHELSLTLGPGRHRYRLVVDGQWRSDQFNPLTEPNEFGDPNNIALVEGG